MTTIKAQLDSMLTECSGQGKIRIDEKTQKVAVIDVVRLIIRKSSKRASSMIRNLTIPLQRVRINGKGRLTPCVSIVDLPALIACLPGKRARSLQASKFEAAIKLKGKFYELLSSGNTNIQQGAANLELKLASATLKKNGQIISSWDYFKGITPTTKQAIRMVEAIFPTTLLEPDPAPEFGTIYFIRVKGTQMIKIGYTTHDIAQRMSQLQVSHPTELEIVRTFLTRNYQEEEFRLHELFKVQRVRGEWFCLPDEVVRSFET